MTTRVLVGIVAFAAVGIASPLEVRQAATFVPPARCTSSVSSFYQGYNCLKTLGTSSASAYCSQRFITTATATGFTNTFTDVTTTSIVNVTGTSTSTTTSFVSTITSNFNTTTTVFTCPSSTASSTDSVSSSSTVASVRATTAGTHFGKSQATDHGPNFASTLLLYRCLSESAHDLLGLLWRHVRQCDNRVHLDQDLLECGYVTAVATKNITSTSTVLTAYPLPTGNFRISYLEANLLGISTYYASAQSLNRGVGVAFSQTFIDDFHFDNQTRLHDTSKSDSIASQPPEGVLDLLFLMNATSASATGTPQCYVCGNATEVGDSASFGCDYPDATGNVTNPGTNVWATCGDYLSLGPAASFANQDIPVDCKIRNLFLILRNRTTNT
ncbi:hypothetical protein LTR56_022182 [Elasticomyces elasticus]|nr:hypothetical protein LTR56_022182 [Elasticomyces elasticus]KAK3631104.1 hypothetical protein LTR22_021222 [Elasticomyces elasticus]KAK5748750.1 hypothetical protein LTS12_021191 [Elasticomyces elasticus]